MKKLRLISALGAFFVAALAISACGSGVPGDSVAVVDGNPITLQAFNHWMYVAAKGQAAQSPGAPVIVPNDPPDFKGCIAQVRKQVPSLAKTPDATVKSDCNQLFRSLSSQVMDFLIKAYWYQALAAKLGVHVTDAEVQKAFNTAKQAQFPTATAFNTFLTQSGQTLQDILFRVRVNQIYMKLLAKHATTVSAAEIANYYNAHKTQFGTPETLDMRIVLAKSKADAEAAKSALASGQGWASVAKKYSTDASTKNSGGQLLGVTPGSEESALNTAAFSAPVNKVLGPIQGTFGFYVFEVNKTTPATQKSLSEVTSQISQLLSSQNQTSAQSAIDAQAKKQWFKATTCRGPYAMADCSGYKAPKSATTLPSTTTPTPTTTTGG
jgi:parvulin-like peptidyl-prolyl isomerase